MKNTFKLSNKTNRSSKINGNEKSEKLECRINEFVLFSSDRYGKKVYVHIEKSQKEVQFLKATFVEVNGKKIPDPVLNFALPYFSTNAN